MASETTTSSKIFSKKESWLFLKLFTLSLASIMAVPAFSQTNPEEQTKPRQAFTIEEVIVTARKREESASDVPLSISVYDSKELKYRQIQTTDQLTNVTPNLHFGTHAPSSGHNSAAPVFIRGVGQPDFIPSSDPGVGLYVDGVYIARSVGAATELLDLDRIEVLRGPQGTLFGRNTIGGAVVLHTKRPEREYGGKLNVLVGTDKRIEIEGDADLPLADNFRLKISSAIRKREGYVRNLYTNQDLGDDDSLGVRLVAEWDLSDSVKTFWSFDYVNENENGSPTVFNSLNTSGLFARLAAGIAGPPVDVGNRGVPDAQEVHQSCQFETGGTTIVPEGVGFVSDLVLNCGTAGTFDLGDAGPYRNYANGELESKLEIWGGSFTLTADRGPVTIKSITAVRSTKYDVKRDADNTPLTILHSENHDSITQFSQELQVSGSALSDRIRWLAGLYWFRENTDFDNPVYLPAAVVGALNNAGELKTENFAVFSQLTYDFTEKLHGTVGARVTREKKQATPNFYAIGSYNVPNPFSTVGLRCGGPNLQRVSDPTEAINRPDAHCISLADGDLLYAREKNELSFRQITPMFSLAYDLLENSLLYFTYSKGFKSGGFSTRIIQPVPSTNNPDGVSKLPTFDPEESDTFEVGYKGQFKDFKFTAAVFSSKYKNQHVVVRQGVAPITFNAGESKIDGFELEWSWTPTNYLIISGGLGYVDGGYNSFTGLLASNYNAAVDASQAGGPPPENIPGLVDLKDNLAYTPKISANLGASYLITTPAGSFTPRLDWSHQGTTYFDAPNSEAIKRGGYSIFNAALSWLSNNEKLEMTLAIKNLTDKEYLIGGNVSFSNSAYAESIYARPREFSFRIQLNF